MNNELIYQIAKDKIRNDFDSKDTYVSIAAIDTAIECGFNDLANEMANDFLSEGRPASIVFKQHYKENKDILTIFDSTVKAVIFDSTQGHYLAQTQVS